MTGWNLEPLDSSGKNKQTKTSKQKSSSKKIQSWVIPVIGSSRPLALKQGCFEECEPCFGVDSFSPGRGLEPLSFMEVLNPFSSYVLHHSTTEPPSAAARYTIRRRCHRSPSSAALAVLRMLMQYHTAPSHRTRETSGASVMLQQSLQGGVGGTVSPDCRSASGRAALVTMLGAFAIEK